MLSITEITIRLLLAAVLGAVIGFDRQRHTWAAGLRTHMLVCLGAALAMIVSAYSFFDVLEYAPNITLDPSRIAAQVISGIGFLGAGTIMFLQREHAIRGLTTAAGLWTVAAIGLAAGGGMYAAAAITTTVAWSILAVLRPLEQHYFVRNSQSHLRVGFVGKASMAAIEKVLVRHPVTILNVLTQRVADDRNEVVVEFSSGIDQAQLSVLLDSLREMAGVESVALEVTPPGG